VATSRTQITIGTRYLEPIQWCEHAKATGQESMIPQYLGDAREYREKSRIAKDEVRERDKFFVGEVCNSHELAGWVMNASQEDQSRNVVQFLGGQLLALLELQIGRLLSEGEDRKSQFDKVLKILQELEESKHSVKVKQSRHMLASIRTIMVADSP